jgi:hypothetical protein
VTQGPAALPKKEKKKKIFFLKTPEISKKNKSKKNYKIYKINFKKCH